MITREEYINLRNENQLSYELFWEYYCEHCKNPIVKNFQHFVQEFTNFNSAIPAFSYKKVLDYYDAKFNVVVLVDVSESKVIRYS